MIGGIKAIAAIAATVFIITVIIWIDGGMQ